MKYCPYCGADLIDSIASFCTECGRTLPMLAGEKQEDSAEKKKPKQNTGEKGHKSKVKQKKRKKPGQPQQVETEKTLADAEYDGYYDDVLPSDIGRLSEGVDKELVKKVVAVAGIMLLIVGLCVLAMYLL